jgi:hypothetical protein
MARKQREITTRFLSEKRGAAQFPGQETEIRVYGKDEKVQIASCGAL